MRAEAFVRAELADGGVTRITRLRGQVPLVPREVQASGPGAEVVFVGGAAGPLGGDDLTLHIEVGRGARLVVRTAAAAVVLPGDGTPARQRLRITVGDGGELEFLPEPVIVTSGSTYKSVLDVTLGRAVRLTLAETLVLGRFDEEPGDATASWNILAEGRPLLRQRTAYGPGAHPGWSGPAGTSGGTVVATGLRVPEVPLPGGGPRSAPGRAVCALAGGGVLTSVVARDTLEAGRLFTG